MSNGIFIRNNSGFVLIDQNFANYRLIMEGVANTNTTVTFPNQPGGVLIFVGNTPQGSQVALLFSTSDSFHLRGTLTGLNATMNRISTFSIAYRVYANISFNPISVNLGLLINNANGQSVFNSNAGYTVASQVNFYNTPTTSQITITKPVNSPFVSISETMVTSGAWSSWNFQEPSFIFQPAYDVKANSIAINTSEISRDFAPGHGDFSYWSSFLSLVCIR